MLLIESIQYLVGDHYRVRDMRVVTDTIHNKRIETLEPGKRYSFQLEYFFDKQNKTFSTRHFTNL